MNIDYKEVIHDTIEGFIDTSPDIDDDMELEFSNPFKSEDQDTLHRYIKIDGRDFLVSVREVSVNARKAS